jgi:hypothetical protein
MVSRVCHPRDSEKYKIGGLYSRMAWAKNKTLSPKLSEQKGLEAWFKW